MPTSYLDSSPPPEMSIDDWLGWSVDDLVRISNDDTYIAALVGINRSGDIQNIYKPIVVKDDSSGKIKAIIGNGSKYKTNPGPVYIKSDGLGSVYLLEKLPKMPTELCPPNPLPKAYITATAWEDTNDVGICLVPLLAPIFFGQKTIEGSVTDKDFVNKMTNISPKHGAWADLMKEVFNQLEENETDVDKIVYRLKTPKRVDEPSSHFTTAAFASSHVPEPPYIFLHQLSNSEKWKPEQELLAKYFQSNPSPTRILRQAPPPADNSDDESIPQPPPPNVA